MPDGSPEPADAESPIAFHPTTRPGSHLPHLWLAHTEGASSSEPRSTRDLVRPTGLTLFVGASAAPSWAEAARMPAGMLPVAVVVIDDADAGWSGLSEVDADGAVLVRPDAKVAWRAMTLPANPAAALREAVATIGAGGLRPDGDPAEPSFERIRRAAAVLAE
ncbi:hypothetical protein [Agromyces archimandritae]|uniref:aromatic-ring hydroxylase C-terminal domain-containing protein n=1 Tax=Agromyces archimandritae TaxID=2781962 RepID=UPI003CC7C8B8